MVPGGGSSSDFSSAFCAACSLCCIASASRMTTTRRLPSKGRYPVCSRTVSNRLDFDFRGVVWLDGEAST